MAEPDATNSRGVTVRRWIASLLGAALWGVVACVIGWAIAWRLFPNPPPKPRLVLDLLLARPILHGWGQILCCLGCAAAACGLSLWLARPWARFGGGPAAEGPDQAPPPAPPAPPSPPDPPA